MSKLTIICAHCGKAAMKETGAVNRARKIGAPVYCDKECAGQHRRKHKTVEQKKAEKSAYDLARRNGPKRDAILAEKRRHHKNTYDPAKAAVYRQKRMPYHVEYCRRPEYREKKKAYDHVYNAKRDYGPLWEIQLLTLDIRAAALERQSDYEIRLTKGTLGKSQKRKRAYDQIERSRPHREVPEVGPLGDIAVGQRR